MERSASHKIYIAFVRVACLLLLGCTAACAPGRDLPFLNAERLKDYRLGVSDQVRVVTYGEEQLSDSYRVADNGSIAFPLLDRIHAQGLTVHELADRIAEALRKEQILRQPSVSVEITAYRPVFVLGEVTKPGEYPYQPGMTFLTLVAEAGGFTDRAIQDYAYAVRTNNQHEEKGRVLPENFLQPGDVIKVYERVF